MKEFARRINFFTSTFVSILGLSLVSEIFLENDLPDKIDDSLMLVLSIVSVYWYKNFGSKSEKTFGSVALLGVAVLIKIGAIIIEHGDKEALGDDIGILTGLVIAFVFVLWQTLTHKENKK